MNKNKHHNKKRPAVSYKEYVLSLLAMALIAGGGVYAINRDRQQPIVEYLASYPDFADLEKVTKTYQEIKDNYVGEIDQDNLIDGAVSGLTQALDDPFSGYFTGQNADDLDDSISGSFQGIGAVMTIKDKQVTIAEEPMKDSAAQKAGLKAGDVITAVDGEEVTDKELTEVVQSIRGEENTEVTLTINRDNETFDVTLTRSAIEIDTVKGELVPSDKKIGHVTINSFSSHTADEFKKVVEDLRKDGAKGFMFDVRQNPGGLLDQVAIMSSMFLEDGETIVKFEDKTKKKNQIIAGKDLDDGFKIFEPAVVLMDSKSASASEIFAAALNQSADIPLVGETTFGKGTVQTVAPISKESDLKLTTSKWLTPKDEWIHEKGIKPTAEIDFKEYDDLKIISTEQTYQLGMSGSSLQNINHLLALLGYNVTADDEQFTEATAAAVRELQTTQGLPVTGIIDKETALKIQQLIAEKIISDNRVVDKGIELISSKLAQ
ncbi:S41 family peptidase [Vagococcus coleopterorum]|uniref:S41 family peptidase n=1 Tax=Vagococcus coleopterorum TaxID=2714946 RepID=A0A6G8ANB9_9ENTE|nr:S41 family peptidase [Vagococcus coleopterorum]QIL46568.1 S41 family peptidase [Vagococcus coleopterorum]